MASAMKIKEDDVSKQIKDLQDPKKRFDSLKSLLLNDPTTLTKVLSKKEGKDAIVVTVCQTDEATKMFAEVFKSESGRKNTAKFLGTEEGIYVVGEAVKTSEGGRTVGNLFGMKNGAKVMSLTLAYHPINTFELGWVDIRNSVVYQKIAPPMGYTGRDLGTFTRTEFGKEFNSYFDSKENAKSLVKKLKDEGFRSKIVDFLKTTEGRSYMRDLLADKEKRHLVGMVMKSSPGRKTVSALAGTKEGVDVISGDL